MEITVVQGNVPDLRPKLQNCCGNQHHLYRLVRVFTLKNKQSEDPFATNNLCDLHAHMRRTQ